jgi:phage shock protein PspC (stress-responsive transcriptional regulator)
MQKIREAVEMRAFGVCTAIGEKLGIATSRIRMWFIYISFITMGSPLILYMIMAFTLKIKQYITAAKRNPFWNL